MDAPRARRDFLRLSAALACCRLVSSPAAAVGAAAVRMGGTGSANELLNRLGRAFRTQDSGVAFTLVPGLGSSGGIKAIRGNALDVAVSARRLKPDEADGIVEVVAFRTPFVLASSHPNPGGVTRGEVARLFSDLRATWPDGSPVRPVIRPRQESDTALIAASFPNAEQAIEAARQRPDVPVAVNDHDNATMGEQLRGSLIAISMLQLATEKRNLRTIPIDGVEGSLESLQSGKYPYDRTLSIIHSKSASTVVRDFIAFIRSPAGARILRECQCLPIA